MYRPETLEIFIVSKVSGRKLSYANARARVGGIGTNLQGFGTQNSTGTLATVSTMGKHNGEAQRGAQREPIVANQKKKSNQKRSQNRNDIWTCFFPNFFCRKNVAKQRFLSLNSSHHHFPYLSWDRLRNLFKKTEAIQIELLYKGFEIKTKWKEKKST